MLVTFLLAPHFSNLFFLFSTLALGLLISTYPIKSCVLNPINCNNLFGTTSRSSHPCATMKFSYVRIHGWQYCTIILLRTEKGRWLGRGIML
ncbi:hypothetical protein DL95DRAFT_396350, partial [Leptodontidium sp. 2 PMI_412]